MTELEPTFFPWASVLRFGLGRLRLNPEHFWRLTLIELAALLDAGDTPAMTSRQALETLMRRFPDRRGEDTSKEANDG